jgi:hypothetical protein
MTRLPLYALVITLSFPVMVEAREGQRSGGFEGKRGSGTYSQNFERGKGFSNRDTIVTGQNGKSAERQTHKTWNRQEGTGTYSNSTTGPRGNTTSHQGTVAKTGEGTYSYQGTTTGPKGNTTTHEGTVTKTAPGQWSNTGSSTGPNGKTFSTESTRTKTETGYNTDKTVTGEGGKSYNRNSVNTRAANTFSSTTTVTGPNGNSKTGSGSVTITPNRP